MYEAPENFALGLPNVYGPEGGTVFTSAQGRRERKSGPRGGRDMIRPPPFPDTKT